MELYLYDEIENDDCVRGILDKDNTTVMRRVIDFAETWGITDNSIREYIVTLLADSDNALSRLAQRGGEIGGDLYKIASFDIEQIYAKLFAATVKYTPSSLEKGFSRQYADSVRHITASESAKELLDRLIEHYRELGTGILSRHTAFKFNGRLTGVSNVEDITFDKLIGLDYQKRILRENTEAFLNGRPANNVLLFGDRGSGKSSSVKALLNMYADDGLRLIELPKQHIKDIPELTAYLNGKPGKYILFLDDLSFETHEKEYRDLKIAMDGQLQANLGNVLIYATSNRRHLIRESWADRQGGEVHRNDQMQETLSLSERFGISLVFSLPNQKEYLNIVSGILKAHGVEMDDELQNQAIIWQMNHGGRSGRCARQFVSAYISR